MILLIKVKKKLKLTLNKKLLKKKTKLTKIKLKKNLLLILNM